MPPTPDPRQTAQDLIAFIDASPSPWHAVASVEQRLRAQGFTRLEEGERWKLAAGGRHYVLRGGASLIAFVLGSGALAETGFRIVGAHTDSPGLRLKPRRGAGRRRPAAAGGGSLRRAHPGHLRRSRPEPGRAGGDAHGGGPQARLLRFEQPCCACPTWRYT
jgi:hypothetical protein